MIERFREQLALVDLQFQQDPDLVRRAAWSCCQEEPVEFMGYHSTTPAPFPNPRFPGG